MKEGQGGQVPHLPRNGSNRRVLVSGDTAPFIPILLSVINSSEQMFVNTVSHLSFLTNVRGCNHNQKHACDCIRDLQFQRKSCDVANVSTFDFKRFRRTATLLESCASLTSEVGKFAQKFSCTVSMQISIEQKLF